ncbi:MAG: hypothetical protein CMQ02_02110 [Gammaproteobacteria bacterium]|nr:hypothetical protein [Gammaproteobacteria bacterium]
MQPGLYDYNTDFFQLHKGAFIKFLNITLLVRFSFQPIVVASFLLACISPTNAQVNAELFPRPVSLEIAVNFWIRVYTEVDTSSGFLHDSENLSIIYARLDQDRRAIEARRKSVEQDLVVLGSGKRTDLTPSQERILALWPDNVSNQRLREAADHVRWQLGQSDAFLAGLERSGAYREHIRDVIRDKNLPPELAVLPHVESSFNPSAYSSAAATGMWQFTRSTGQRFMRIDHIVDERMDPYIAADAAMSLLEYNYRALGAWPLALTAYNHGAGGISRAVRETGTSSIDVIVAQYKGPRFGFASRNFYAQFLAVNDVEKDAERYFGRIDFAQAPDYVEVRTDAFIDAQVFADSIGISLDRLRRDNPALRTVVWDGVKRIPRGFRIKLPASEFSSESQLLASIGQDFKYPVQTPDISYQVERGDSLSVIAERFNTTVGQLVSLNQLRSRNSIQIGQRLLLPQSEAQAAKVAVSDEGIYTITRGDTISTIARRFNVNAGELLRLNGVADARLIYPGQELKLPGLFDQDAQLAEASAIASNATVIAENTTNGPSIRTQDIREVENTNASAVSQAEIASNSGSQVALVETPKIGEGVRTPSSSRNQMLEESPGSSDGPVDLASKNQPGFLDEDFELDQGEGVENGADAQISVAESEAIALESDIEILLTETQLAEFLAADPSDYSVASDGSIEAQASETLGHFADWLDIRAWDIRRLNNMAYRDPVIIGKRLSLNFDKVSRADFELRRRDFHFNMQREFFATYRIQDVEEYEIRRGDNISRIARSQYSAPLWLIRQYNPDIDFNRIRVGQRVVFPLLAATQL